MTATGGQGRRASDLALCLLLLTGALTGCGDGHRYGPPIGRNLSIPTCPKATATVRNVSVDTDAGLTTEPGHGTGVFVEYTAGGHWHIWTVCDTALSGYDCAYDVTGQVIGGKASNILPEELEGSDLASSSCDDTAFLTTSTGRDFDAMWFDAPAGATLRVTAALGSALYPNLIYWISNAMAHDDANANPLELTPTSP